MAERTYLYGYSNPVTHVTLAQLETKWTWEFLHPEMRRRILAMLNACQDAGFDCGVGEGARSTASQLSTFLNRHTQVLFGGCCGYNGKRYSLKAGNAHAAPPGSSCHEDWLYEGYALAADLRGWENHWFDANCHRFGLKNFGGKIGPNVNNEEWHYQPVEFANSRSSVLAQIKLGVKLNTALVLPGEEIVEPPPVVEPPEPDIPPAIVEDDPMIVLVITDVRPPYARWKTDGVIKSWIQGDASAQVDLRLSECENGTKPSPVDGFVYRELRHGSNDVIASYGAIVGPKPGPPFDDYGRLL